MKKNGIENIENSRIKNFVIAKKKLLRGILILGVTGSLGVVVVKGRPYVDPDKHSLGFYFINTKGYDYTSEEFLKLFEDEFNSNSYMKDNFECVYPQIRDFVSKYGSYLDQEEILDTMSTFKVEYITDKEYGSNILGVTDYYGNKIKFNERLNYKTEDESNEVKFHEFLHFLFKQQFMGSRCPYLDEGTVGLLVRESDMYANIDEYKKATYYVRTLCEIVGADNYIKAFCHHDYGELRDYLSQYASKSDIKSLMNYIRNACNNARISGTPDDIEAWKIIDKMYEKKNGCTIENSNDQIMKIYSNEVAGTVYSIDGARSYYQAEANKNYFINVSDSSITYSENGAIYGESYLDDNNSIISSSSSEYVKTK